jgi:hypothetical protein
MGGVQHNPLINTIIYGKDFSCPMDIEAGYPYPRKPAGLGFRTLTPCFFRPEI